MGVWADSGIAIPGSGFKFETDGDTISGVLVKAEPLHIEAKDDKLGMDTLSITLRAKNGDEIETGLMGIDLRIKFAKADPDLGDWLKIKRVGKAGNKVLFDLEHRVAPKATSKAPDPDEDEDTVPF